MFLYFSIHINQYVATQFKEDKGDEKVKEICQQQKSGGIEEPNTGNKSSKCCVPDAKIMQFVGILLNVLLNAVNAFILMFAGQIEATYGPLSTPAPNGTTGT